MNDSLDEVQQPASTRARLPHVVMDRGSRMHKARKIVALIGEERFHSARRVLEIGCGSGVIASTMALLGGDGMVVHAVDVVDNRMESAGYEFHLVEGTKLPFEDGCFDIVVSNHVIEHVGDRRDQLAHLGEIRRVLSRGGMVYLAVPNRWRLVEPHFRLPFLSWLPPALSDRYVRLAARGTHYDCLPLASREALSLFADAGFRADDVTVRALHETIAIEFPDYGLVPALNRALPDWLAKMALPIMPTYVYLLTSVGR